MSKRVDRKIQDVVLAEYRYRHEAEFTAGFLEDAGIPYRLQIDDAGGADLGLGMLRPAIVWVRAVDIGPARELMGMEVDDHRVEHEVHTRVQPGRPEAQTSGFTGLERAVSAGIGLAMLSGIPYVPFGPYRPLIGMVCLAGGCVFAIAALMGRAPGPLDRVIRSLAGSPPR